MGEKLGAFLTQAIGERLAGPVFLSPAGKAWTVPNLSRTYSRLRDLAGLPRDLVLYLARHECGTKVCRQKGIEYARRCWGTRIFRQRNGICTWTTRSWPTRRISLTDGRHRGHNESYST